MRRFLHAAAVGLAVVFVLSAESSASGTEIPVPTVTILQGDLVAEELIIDQRVTASARVLRNFHTSREAVVGKVARRVLPAGHAIPINALREPWVFKEGDRVSLVFASGGLSIETTGIALGPGVAGEYISVRNADTGIVVRGVVQASGRGQLGRD